MATKYGIDVSKHNGSIDWARVKASGKADFAILRAGLGKVASQKDARFEEYYKCAKSVGIPVGAYWYSYAMSVEEAKQEAATCIECLKGKQFEYPIFFDVEEKTQLALGKDKLTAIVSAFLSEVEKAGYWVGLYMSASPLSILIRADIAQRYSVWVAHVGVSKPSYSGRYEMWQHSWKGVVSGIVGDVDLDECYADFPALIKAKHLNGWTAETPTPTKPETKEISLTIDGATWAGTLTKKEG